jgi:hypothetical protein
MSHYKFGDISRWLVAWYRDHPGSLAHQFDWLKFVRTVVSSLVVAGGLTTSNVLAVLVGALQESAYSQETWSRIVLGVTGVYTVVDFLYRLFYGKPAEPKTPATPAV